MNRLRRVPILRRAAVLGCYHRRLGCVAWEVRKVRRKVEHVLSCTSYIVGEDHSSGHFADNMPSMVDVVAVEDESFVAPMEECKLVVCLLGRSYRLSVVDITSIYMMLDTLITAPLIPML